MTFLSISIDICGSTDAKAKLIDHAKQIDGEVAHQYETYQKYVLWVESNFWSMLRGAKLDIERLFLIKTIGDELWYSYDLNGLQKWEEYAAIMKMVGALTSLHSKNTKIVVGPESDPHDWENEDPSDFLQLDLPVKITIDLISNALEMNALRLDFLKPHVASLMSPLGKSSKPVAEGDIADLCNQLGVYSGISTGDKLHRLIRSDFIGWEVDRFFRLAKESKKGTVLIGPAILAICDDEENNAKLIEPNGTEKPGPGNWMISEPMLRIMHGSGFTTLGHQIILARKTVSAKELKGVGQDCPIAIAYSKFQQGVEL